MLDDKKAWKGSNEKKARCSPYTGDASVWAHVKYAYAQGEWMESCRESTTPRKQAPLSALVFLKALGSIGKLFKNSIRHLC